MFDPVSAERVVRAFSGTPWEPRVGFCRAVRVGRQAWVSGTAPVGEEGQVVAPGDAYLQARRCLEIISQALREVAPEGHRVVRTRMYVTDIRRWAEFGRAHQEFFGDCPPATTMVEVRALIDPAMLVEVEAEALCGEGLEG
jgi:isochorismate pyruvate lyase